MLKHILLGLALALLVSAGYYTFAAPVRYGTFLEGDPGVNARCASVRPNEGVRAHTETRFTVLGYYMMTDSEPSGGQFRGGVCPYNEYRVKTYALDLWALGLLTLLYSGHLYRQSNKSND